MSKRSSYVFSNNDYLEEFKLVAIIGAQWGAKEVQKDAAEPLGRHPARAELQDPDIGDRLEGVPGRMK